MIKRYQDKNITNIWSEDIVTKRWLILETMVLEGWEKQNLISLNTLNELKDGLKINIERWKEIEKETKHEFVAFLQMLEENFTNKNVSKWIHYGLTSSDILDSGTSIGLTLTLEYISELLFDFQKILLDLKDKNNSLDFIGRTHGQYAEVQKFSFVIDRWYSELKRCIIRLNNTIEKVSIIKLSGPIGNNNIIPKELEKYVALRLKFKVAENSSQIISRDIYADYFYSLAMIASLLEKIATYIRLLSLSGINELNEGFLDNQIGSSAMPHKKNPILCENVCGLSRMIKSYLITAIDNNNSWLERDMSHSSIERITIEDAAHLTSHSIKNMIKIINNLNIDKHQIQKNINQNLTKLNSHKNMLEVIRNENISRKDAHKKIMEEVY